MISKTSNLWTLAQTAELINLLLNPAIV